MLVCFCAELSSVGQLSAAKTLPHPRASLLVLPLSVIVTYHWAFPPACIHYSAFDPVDIPSRFFDAHLKGKDFLDTMSNLLPLLLLGTHLALLWNRDKNLRDFLTWSLPHPFPFMRLPVEIQSRIIKYAIKQAYRPPFEYPPSQIAYKEDVRHLLCVSRYFHALAVPELYTRIIWRDEEQSSSLITTLRLHPQYIRHVREVELILGWNPHQDLRLSCLLVEILRFHENPSWDVNSSMVTRLSLTTEHPQEEAAICLVGILRPTQLEWTYKISKSDLERGFCPSFSKLMQNRWIRPYLTTLVPPRPLPPPGVLDQVVRLRFSWFNTCVETAHGLASLPNLQSLTLSGNPTSSISREYLSVILTTGHTRRNLTALSLCGIPFALRRELHSKLGLCILTAVGANFDCETSVCDLRHGPEQKVWHGCLDIAEFDHHEHLLGPHIECPRCCTIAGQPVVMPDDPCPSSQTLAVEPHTSTIPDAQEPSWRFGLCDHHHGEIFSQHLERDDQVRHDDVNFFHKRLLECVRWHSCRKH